MKTPLALSAPEGLWLGNAASWHRLVHALKRIDELDPEQLKALAFDWDEDEDEDAPGHWMLTRQGETAFIQISGPLTSEESVWFRLFGITSYGEIRNAIAAAIEGGAKQGVLVFNSPGGSVSGVSETAGFLRSVSSGPLPLTAYTGTQMTSAAYWLASATNEIVAAPLSAVGSIGVIAVHTEYTQMLKDMGITASVFRSGKYKALENPYEQLSQVAAEEIQADLDFVYDAFTHQVANARGMSVGFLRQHAAEGKCFYAEQALPLGLIDGIDSLEGVAQRLSEDTTPGDYTMTLKTDPKAGVIVNNPDLEETEEEERQERENEQEDPQEDKTAARSESTRLWAQVEQLQEQLVEAKVQIRELRRYSEQRGAEVNALLPLVIEATNRLEVGLGRPEVDLSSLSPMALVERFTQANTEFKAAFPVGGKFVTRTEDDSPQADTLEAAVLDPRVVNLSRFKR